MHTSIVFEAKGISKEQKIGFFSRFIGEKSVFGWHGNDFDKKKIGRKKIGK